MLGHIRVRLLPTTSNVCAFISNLDLGNVMLHGEMYLTMAGQSFISKARAKA